MNCQICDLAHDKEGLEYCCAALISDKNEIVTAYNSAMSFAIGMRDMAPVFLSMWSEGDWKGIEREFPSFDLSTAKPCGYRV
jgi:hypothetical protein